NLNSSCDTRNSVAQVEDYRSGLLCQLGKAYLILFTAPIHEGPGGSEALARRMPRRWFNLAWTLSPAVSLTPKGSSSTADAPSGGFEDNNPPSGASHKKHK